MWRKFVIDRYVLVLTIFKLHASSKEAKLQIARLMVELIKHRVESNCLPWYVTDQIMPSKGIVGANRIAKGAVTAKEKRKLAIHAIEARVKTSLNDAKQNRVSQRKQKLLSHVPLISVIGYTNCGKTTLIKSLTETHKLCPENKLFATTEASSHFGLLENDVSCIYNDTVGFISDMPHELVAAFTASFEEICGSQLVVHVSDISHPDWRAQMHVVQQTISQMLARPDALPLRESCWIEVADGERGTEATIREGSFIHVMNKCDLLSSQLVSLTEVSKYFPIFS